MPITPTNPFQGRQYPRAFESAGSGWFRTLVKCRERHHELDILQTQGEIEIQPDALGNNLFRKTVAAIRVGWHSLRISSALLDSTVIIAGLELAEESKKHRFEMGKLAGRPTTTPEIWAAVLAA